MKFRFLLVLIYFICYGVSGAQITIKVALLDQLMSQKYSSCLYKEDYLNGLKVALNDAKNNLINVKFKYFEYGKGPLDILRAVPLVKKWKPDVIIGPRFSNSMLLLKNQFNDILVISPLATSIQLKNLPKNFYSISLSEEYIAKALVMFIKHHFPQVPGVLALAADNCVSCKNSADYYLNGMREQFKKTKTSEKVFNSENVEKLNLENLLKNYQPGFIIYSPNISYVSGVLISRIVDYLKDNNIIFLGNDGWGSQEVAYVNKIESKFIYKSYHLQNWSVDYKTKEIKEFDKKCIITLGKTSTDSITYASYKVLHSILSLININDFNNTKSKNKYILNSRP